jgi:hypothetical protein
MTKSKSVDSDTQSIATTFSISNTNSLGKILARLRGQKSNKEFWMPDEQCKECYKCRKQFTVFRRKHHCRFCGKSLHKRRLYFELTLKPLCNKIDCRSDLLRKMCLPYHSRQVLQSKSPRTDMQLLLYRATSGYRQRHHRYVCNSNPSLTSITSFQQLRPTRH